jgi:hypothetical protein
MELDRISELAGVDIDEDAYASEKAKGQFATARANLKNLEKVFSEGSPIYKYTKDAGGDAKEFELVAKSIEHLKASIDHAEQSAQIPDQSSRRDRSGW